MRHVITEVFLWLGVGLTLVSCLGVLVLRTAHARLHFSSPSVLGAVCVAVAVVVQNSFSLVGNKAILIAVFLLITSPILTHATARAARVQETGHWPLAPDEGVEVEEP